jgi:aldehyde dehydrogenase (NAD+)
MGGKNAQIVLDDADLDLALDGVLWGAFGTNGQRCTATSRLIVQEGVHDSFVSRLRERVNALKLGDGRRDGTDVGPLIHAEAVAKVERYIDIGQKEGATLACGGSSIYTRNVQVAFRALQELDNGITYVNAPTIGAEAHLPFGGVKQTGNGHREGGWEVYEFYSETKVGYVDYSGVLQRAQLDTYTAD